jgi:cholesterol transport system auxiliary component
VAKRLLLWDREKDKMKNLMALGIILLSTICLSSCLGPVKTPTINTFTLSRHVSMHRSDAATHKTLLVSNTTATPAYQTTDMLYEQHAYELKAFAKNRWIAPPAQMLTPVIAENLRAQAYFKAVVTAPFVGSTDLRLDTQLLSFKQEFLADCSQFKMSLQAVLVNTETRKIIASRRFDAVVQAPENTPYGGVYAANKATAIIMNAVGAFVKKH